MVEKTDPSGWPSASVHTSMREPVNPNVRREVSASQMASLPYSSAQTPARPYLTMAGTSWLSPEHMRPKCLPRLSPATTLVPSTRGPMWM